jgi:uncharacterized damage-inducible protein DinB
MIDDVIQAWRTNCRVNQMLLAEIGDDGLRATLSKRGGRDVARQFAHLHTVRAYHLENRAKGMLVGLRKFGTEESPSREELLEALADSARRVEEWLRRAHAGEKGFRLMKRGLAQTLAYLVAHESHHRGNILLTLKECGHAVDSKVRYAIWDWDRI